MAHRKGTAPRSPPCTRPRNRSTVSTHAKRMPARAHSRTAAHPPAPETCPLASRLSNTTSLQLAPQACMATAPERGHYTFLHTEHSTCGSHEALAPKSRTRLCVPTPENAFGKGCKEAKGNGIIKERNLKLSPHSSPNTVRFLMYQPSPPAVVLWGLILFFFLVISPMASGAVRSLLRQRMVMMCINAASAAAGASARRSRPPSRDLLAVRVLPLQVYV